MGQVLSGAIGARAIVRSAGLGAGTGGPRTGRGFERAANATLRTTYTRNLPTLGNGCYDVPALLLTFGAELVDAIANGVGSFFDLFLHWHKKQTRAPIGRSPWHERALPFRYGLIGLDWSATGDDLVALLKRN